MQTQKQRVSMSCATNTTSKDRIHFCGQGRCGCHIIGRTRAHFAMGWEVTAGKVDVVGMDERQRWIRVWKTIEFGRHKSPSECRRNSGRPRRGRRQRVHGELQYLLLQLQCAEMGQSTNISTSSLSFSYQRYSELPSTFVVA